MGNAPAIRPIFYLFIIWLLTHLVSFNRRIINAAKSVQHLSKVGPILMGSDLRSTLEEEQMICVLPGVLALCWG